MLKLILADNQVIFRAGAAKVLAVEDEVRVVAQTNDYEQTLMALERFRPTVMLFSANLHKNLPDVVGACGKYACKLIVVADNGVPASKFAQPGVHGVVFRNITGPTLTEGVRKVAKGQQFIQHDSPSGTEEAADDQVGARVRDRLTPKELKIVSLIVQGFKNKEIATQLGTTEQVIKNYLRNVYDKIGVSDRLELALFTIHHRMLAEAAAASTAAMGAAH